MTLSTPKTTKSIRCEHNCDSIEVNSREDKIFVGMYEYEESSSSRGGGYLVLDKDGNTVSESLSRKYGALDAKWIKDDFVLVACSDGIVRKVCGDDGSIVGEFPVVDSPGSVNTANILMTIDTATNSDGSLTIATITAKGELSVVNNGVVEKVQAHSPVFESWTCAVNPSLPTMIGTGSDDCVLKIWDSRSLQSPVLENKRAHSMGVTCIEFLADGNELLTGSYDERIRRFDIRNMSHPVIEKKTIGGVWRLKPREDQLFVAACYGGCVVVGSVDFEPLVTEYTEHESMAYGIGALSNNSAVSCSFYDKLVQFWSF
jgi:diphthamide biosynthesis protein 7